MKILILGATGMLGSTLFKYFSNINNYEVYGTLRDLKKKIYFEDKNRKNLLFFKNYENVNELKIFLKNNNPDIVFNCLGVIKQNIKYEKTYKVLFINSYLPKVLSVLAKSQLFRLIHFSTDCVFDGIAGSYKETDIPIPNDFYGLSKLLGELNNKSCLTLRTSIIGHELCSSNSLIEWFLSSQKSIRGYSKAIYTGFPTVEIARILNELIIPNKSLNGLLHLSTEPINKYKLLKIVANTYGHKIKITPDENFVIDRSLDSTLFKSITGYKPPSWNKLIQNMFDFHTSNGFI